MTHRPITNSSTSNLPQYSSFLVKENILTITLVALLIIGAATATLALNSMGAASMPYLSYASYGFFASALFVLSIKVVSLIVNQVQPSATAHTPTDTITEINNAADNSIPSQVSSWERSQNAEPRSLGKDQKSDYKSSSANPLSFKNFHSKRTLKLFRAMHLSEISRRANLGLEDAIPHFKLIEIPEPESDLKILFFGAQGHSINNLLLDIKSINSAPIAEKTLFILCENNKDSRKEIESKFKENCTINYQLVFFASKEISEFTGDLLSALNNFSATPSTNGNHPSSKEDLIQNKPLNYSNKLDKNIGSSYSSPNTSSMSQPAFANTSKIFSANSKTEMVNLASLLRGNIAQSSLEILGKETSRHLAEILPSVEEEEFFKPDINTCIYFCGYPLERPEELSEFLVALHPPATQKTIFIYTTTATRNKAQMDELFKRYKHECIAIPLIIERVIDRKSGYKFAIVGKTYSDFKTKLNKALSPKF